MSTGSHASAAEGVKGAAGDLGQRVGDADAPTVSGSTVGGSTDVASVVLRGLFDGGVPEVSGEFQPLWPGVEILPLYGLDAAGQPTAPAGPAAALLRYAPGASVPRHHHPGHEHILVLQGSQQDHRASYGPGSFVVNPPGSQHAVSSPDGCLVLAIWTRPVQVMEASDV